MEILQNSRLPQSGEHIILLNILFLITLLVFVSFLAILWGNTLLAMICKLIPDERTQTGNIQNILAEFMDHKRIFAYILAVFPQFALLTIFMQLLSESHVQVYPLFIWTALFMFFGQFFYFRHQNRVRKNSNTQQFPPFLVMAILFLTMATWSAFAAFDGIIDLVHGENIGGIIQYIFSLSTFLKVLTFGFLAVSISSAFSIFKLSYSSDIKDSEKYIGISLLAQITLASLSTLPIWGVIAFFFFPIEILSANLFLLLSIALVLSVILAIQYFVLVERPSQKLAISGFLLFLITLVPIFGADHIVIYNATSVPREKLLAKAEIIELKKSREVNLTISETELFTKGEKIYNTICFACHQFDKKIVGPPYNEVLPKYKNDHAAMKAFILNPRRINENYPPMPAQPLKPQDADAVIVYLLKRLETETAKK